MNTRYAVPTVCLAASLLFSACGADDSKKAAQPAASQGSDSPAAAAPAQMDDAIAQYRAYVIQECDQLVKEADQFAQAVKSGDIEKAKSLYAPSRMHYERIEPIAEALGDLDPDIDARENDVEEAEWRGYHRLEKALWHDNSTKDAAAFADRLLNDVKLLRAKVESVEIDTGMLVTGAVELLNEVSSSKVTGEEERYSRTDLYDFAANVEGAKKIYELLRPELHKKDAALEQQIGSRFAELEQTLAPFRKNGGYVSYDQLKPEETRKLSQAIDALAEPLSNMGKLLGV